MTAATCGDAVAYATLLTSHARVEATYTRATASDGSGSSRSTFLDSKTRPLIESRHRMLSLVTALVRSVRRYDRDDCAVPRPFIILLGNEVNETLDTTQRAALLHEERVRLHVVPPLVPGVPAADKLAAWTLTEYEFIMFLDADLMVVQPIAHLFAAMQRSPSRLQYLGAAHAYDLVQAGCGLPIGARTVSALFVLRPAAATYRRLLAW